MKNEPHVQENSHKTIRRCLIRNFCRPEGNKMIHLNTERKNAKQECYTSEAVLQKLRKDNDFPNNQKLRNIHHHDTCLTRSPKRSKFFRGNLKMLINIVKTYDYIRKSQILYFAMVACKLFTSLI